MVGTTKAAFCIGWFEAEEASYDPLDTHPLPMHKFFIAGLQLPIDEC